MHILNRIWCQIRGLSWQFCERQRGLFVIFL